MNIMISILLISTIVLNRVFLTGSQWYGGKPHPVESSSTARMLAWIPDLLFIWAVIIILICITRHYKIYMKSKYVLLILSYVTICILSAWLNGLDMSAAFVGLRIHLKHLPFFILPALIQLSPSQMKYHLRMVFILVVIQVPIAIIQKVYFNAHNLFSGDFVRGTLDDSGVLSVFIICTIAIMHSLHLRQYLSKRIFLLTTAFLLLPTTINETKISVILIPIAIFVPTLFGTGVAHSKRIKGVIVSATICILLLSAFAVGYNAIEVPEKRKSSSAIASLVEDKGFLSTYLYKDVKGKKGDDVRRFDSIVLGFKIISNDFTKFVFGYGPGSVSESYVATKKDLFYKRATLLGARMTLVSQLIWEVGVSGLIIYILFFWFLFKDVRLLMKVDDFFGSIALGWAAVLTIISICLVYFNMFGTNAVNLLFWFFSGLIASNVKYRNLDWIKSTNINWNDTIEPHHRTRILGCQSA